MKFVNNILDKKMSCFIFPLFCVVIGAILLFFLDSGLYLLDIPVTSTRLLGGSGQRELKADEIIRFHVRAHSSRPEDQESKNNLARAILSLYGPRWSNCRSKEELHRILAEDKEDLEITARSILAESGFGHDVKVSLEKGFFPARLYEGKLYPPGEYEALTVFIGDGSGENWWCVLFPPLCFNALPMPHNEGTNDRTAVERNENSDLLPEEKEKTREPIYRFWLVEILLKFARCFTGA